MDLRLFQLVFAPDLIKEDFLKELGILWFKQCLHAASTLVVLLGLG